MCDVSLIWRVMCAGVRHGLVCLPHVSISEVCCWVMCAVGRCVMLCDLRCCVTGCDIFSGVFLHVRYSEQIYSMPTIGIDLYQRVMHM